MAYARRLVLVLILATALASPLQGLAQSDVVRDVQDRLTTFGYDPGPIDGFMGPKTRAALRSFQERSGLPVTGEADAGTVSALGVNSTARPSSVQSIDPAPDPQLSSRTRSLGTSRTAAAGVEAATSSDGSGTASRTTYDISDGSSEPAKPSGGVSLWWFGGIGLVLFLLWRRWNRQAAKISRQPEREPDIDLGNLGISVERSAPTTPPARWRGTRQDGNDFWVPADKSKTLAGHDIGGMVYVGRGLRGERSGRVENCLIDPSLPVAKRNADVAGEHMPYWPSYADIPPTSRLAYLRWLSSGRSDPETELGYVFLYFYGLERRLFLDQPSENERSALISEVQRLRGIYGWNGSFDRYSRILLDSAIVLSHAEGGPRPDPASLIERSGWELPLSLKLGLGRRIGEGQPLDGEWLLCWWLAHPETRLRTPAKRAFDEFKSLFLLRFAKQFPGGLQQTRPKRALKHTFRSASGSFERDFSRELAGYPDVERLAKPVTIAAGIAERCIDDLDAYSRYLGRKPDGRGSIEAHALLPEELAAQMPNAELEALRVWADQQIAQSDGAVPVEAILERLEGEPPTRVGRRALTGAADALARISVGLAPDPRFAIRAPKAGEPVMLFRLPGEITRLEDVSSAYSGALLSIVLGTYIAHADGFVSDIERQRLQAQIDRMTNLSHSERARLHANLMWMIVVPPKLGQLRKHFDAVGEEQKQAIGRLAIAVAGADGVIDPAEVNAVQKLYRAMGLPDEQIFSDLHEMAAGPASEPVTVFKAGEQPKGFPIPGPPGETKAPKGGALRLDHDRISSIMADTQRASRVLSEIFVDDAAEDNAELEDSDQENAGPAPLNGLDSAHRALIEELLTRPSWGETELAQLAGQFGLMTEGALETVNEWAFEQFNDALLEDDGDFLVNPDIVEVLKNDTRRTSHDATQHQTA